MTPPPEDDADNGPLLDDIFNWGHVSPDGVAVDGVLAEGATPAPAETDESR